MCDGSSTSSTWLADERLVARSTRLQKGQQQLCGNTDSPARGLNSILPSHSCNGGGGERILFLKHLYCYNTKHKRAKANLQENQTTVCTGINLTPHINKPQKLTHIKHQAAPWHPSLHKRKEWETESCIIKVVGPLVDCRPIISLLLDNSAQRTCGLII